MSSIARSLLFSMLISSGALLASPAQAFQPAREHAPPPEIPSALLSGRDTADFLRRLELSPAQEALWERAEMARSGKFATAGYRAGKERERAIAMIADGNLPIGEAMRRIAQARLDDMRDLIEIDNLWLAFLDSLDPRQSDLLRGYLIDRMEMAENARRAPPSGGRPDVRAGMPACGGEGRPRPLPR